MKKIKIIAFFGIIIFVFLAFSTPSTIFVPAQEEGSVADTLLVGTTSFGYDLDPQNAWDSASFEIIHQVSEGLFAYDLGDQYLRTVPRLAADCGSWSENHLEFTVKLREGVTFHNGNPFNAGAVKASFDRLNHLIESGKLQTAELYKPLNEELIINRTEVIDEYTIKFILNYAFAPFLSLLCFSASYIVDTNVMPANDIIPPNETLVGTGPYLYKGNDGKEVQFEYFPDYYLGTPAVKKFTFVKYDSSASISQALLSGDVHMGGYDPDFLMSFLGSEKLIVEDPKPGSVITYIAMNNEIINRTMRHASSYAIDYEYIISHIYRNLIARMTSVVPPGITFHKPQDVANYNISKARQILIDAGLSQNLNEESEDAEWIALAGSSNPIANYSYIYISGSSIIREEIGIQLQNDMALIGISIELRSYTFSEWISIPAWLKPISDFYFTGWMPDYNDPFNYIDPLFSNTSSFNYAYVNDLWLQEKMKEGLIVFNETARAQIYYDIQEYIATDLIPWLFIGFNNGISVHSIHVTDLQRNTMGYLYIFPLTWYGEKAEISDEFFEYCNTCGAPPKDEKNKIAGYNLIVMLGIATTTIIIINYKKKRR